MRLMRGRVRKSSGPRISCHSSETAGTFVKKRWPPMSKRQPSRSTVRLMPPTVVSASSTVARAPFVASMRAAVRPAGPAPMMTMWLSRDPSIMSLFHRPRSGRGYKPAARRAGHVHGDDEKRDGHPDQGIEGIEQTRPAVTGFRAAEQLPGNDPTADERQEQRGSQADHEAESGPCHEDDRGRDDGRHRWKQDRPTRRDRDRD